MDEEAPVRPVLLGLVVLFELSRFRRAHVDGRVRNALFGRGVGNLAGDASLGTSERVAGERRDDERTECGSCTHVHSSREGINHETEASYSKLRYVWSFRPRSKSCSSR